MATNESPACPECDKALAVQDDNRIIGEFLEWLQSQHLHLCRWRLEGNNGEPRYLPGTEKQRSRDSVGTMAGKYDNPDYESWGSGWVTDDRDIEQLLADYRGIDTQKMAAEQDALMAWIRAKREREDT